MAGPGAEGQGRRSICERQPLLGVELKDCTSSPELGPNPTRKVTAKDLTAEFVKDEKAAREKYLGKAERIELIVEGTVADFSENDTGSSIRYSILLAGSKEDSVECRLGKSDFKSLKKGDKVTIKGDFFFAATSFKVLKKAVLVRSFLLKKPGGLTPTKEKPR